MTKPVRNECSCTRVLMLSAIAWLALVAPAAFAQAAPAPALPARMQFDVISVRQHNGNGGGAQTVGATPDGYRTTNMPLMVTLLTAYVPQGGNPSFFNPDQIKGIPDWANGERYDILAKIGNAEMEQWQKPDIQKPMLQAMLQSLLQDRCKLVVHRETKEVSVYFLVSGKSGPKFTPTNPDDPHEGVKLPFGGVMSPSKDGIKLLDTPMSSFAPLLASVLSTGRPVLDKTGLTGSYDITLKLGSIHVQGTSPDGTASDPGPTMFSVVEGLGLKLEPGKALVETLVIDHMERPSEN